LSFWLFFEGYRLTKFYLFGIVKSKKPHPLLFPLSTLVERGDRGRSLHLFPLPHARNSLPLNVINNFTIKSMVKKIDRILVGGQLGGGI
jgi:hypothetical protein